jgi:ADP-heptose:LPS heptosyltransferase
MANIVLTELGIGDVICALYALEGYSLFHPNDNINFYLKQHIEWAAMADIPNMKCHVLNKNTPIDKAVYLYDETKDPGRRLRHSTSPKELFAKALGVKPFIPAIMKGMRDETAIFAGDYVVISPFASRINRSWPLSAWKTLVKKFMDEGLRVIALDGPFESSRCASLGVEFYWGQTPAWVANVCLNAKLVVSNDSGMAHLAGWLGVKSLVIMTQLFPDQYYDYTLNTFITQSGSCTGCQFLPEKGYKPICDYHCAQLNAITAESVFEKAWTVLSD